MDHRDLQVLITECHYWIWQWEEERHFLERLAAELAKDIADQKARLAELDGQYYKARRNAKQIKAAGRKKRTR